MAYTNTLVKSTLSSANALRAGIPDADKYIRRYQLSSFTIYGTVIPFHSEWIEGRDTDESGTAYSHYSKTTSTYRHILVQTTSGVQCITVFDDQDEGINDLLEVKPGDTISVVVAKFTSTSGRFVNTHRVWSVLDPTESLRVGRLAHNITPGQDPAVTIRPELQKLIDDGSHPARLTLNRWMAYLPPVPAIR